MDTAFVARGVIVPIFTHFDREGFALDESITRDHVMWLLEKGIHGLMTCGTTGEVALLATNERKALLEIVMDQTRHRVPVMAHVGAVTTQETLDMARHARACHVDAISVVTPYYYRLSDRELLTHFCRVAESVPDMPMYLYNIPQNAGNVISKALVEEIVSRCPNVVGAKDSSGNLQAMIDLVGIADGKFQVICGSDGLIVQALEGGACAAVSGNANVFPEILVSTFDAFWRGDLAQAQSEISRLGEVRRALGSGSYLSLLKSALRARGLRAGAVRAPLSELSVEEQEGIRRRLGEIVLV
ncbi:MAG: dihydrodipicolinate synthase family protein [Anaerolineae bacterium]